MRRSTRLICLLAGAASLFWPSLSRPCFSETTRAAPGRIERGETAPVTIAYITGDYARPASLSLLQASPDDLGEAGARVAFQEIALAGRFIGHGYALDIVRLKTAADLAAQMRPVLATTKLLVVDLEPKDLLILADMPEAKDALILDMRTKDDVLRQEKCRRNTFHLLPSVAMRTDALAQYLLVKRWSKWLILKGTTPEDGTYADALERSAKKFGAKVVEERTYGYDAGSRRVDTGYQQIQTQMPLATRNAPAHDVLVVADVADVFGDYLPYATTEPRPVVGTQGLVAGAWSPAFQEYSALQMQHRFEIAAHRPMREADYAGWLAIRALGEAVTRGKATEAKALAAYMRSPDFSVAGFKGQGLTFRPWDQQLRQPVLLSTPLMVVSMSPQEPFLHPKFLTDSLGTDEPESKCHLPS